MKNLLDLKPAFTPVKKWKRKKNTKNKPLPKMRDSMFEGICRVLPAYVAHNYTYFEQLPEVYPRNVDAYVLRVRSKIAKLKEIQ